MSERNNRGASCTFVRDDERFSSINLSSTLERAPMQFRSGMAQELLVTIFQRLVSYHWACFNVTETSYLKLEFEICTILQSGKTDWINN